MIDDKRDVPFVRLVVLNWNAGYLLDRCLDSLHGLDWPKERLEIVVIDNASTDGSVDDLAASHPGVRLVRNSSNTGFGANNLALADLDGVDQVGLVNPDVVIEPTWLSELSRALVADPGLGAACPKILLDEVGESRIQNAGSRIDLSGNSHDRGYGESDGPEYADSVEVDAWCGAAVLLDADYLGDVGTFEERFFLYYEDTDLSWRGRNRDWRFRFVPTAVCRHRHGAATGLETPDMRRFQARNRLLVATRNGSPVTIASAWTRTLLGLLRPRPRPRLAGLVDAVGQLRWALQTRAEIRRRPRRDPCSGVVDLHRLSGTDWEIVGPEPRFLLDAERIPTGWVRVRARCVLDNLSGLTPTLRIVGASDQNPYVVRLGRRGLEGIDHVLAVPEGVQSLELVVVPGAGTVRLEGLELSRISRPGAIAFMLRAVVRDLRGYSRHRQAELARNIIRRLFRQGPRATMRGLGRRYSSRGKLIVADQGSVPYLDWLRAFDPVGETDRTRAAEAIDGLSEQPLVSIVMPVYDTDEVWLRLAIDSVRAQWYENWELCIADDASTSPHVATVLAEYSALDPRIRSMRRNENGHISAASNSALELATGDWIALLDHDDVLQPHALAAMVLTAAQSPDVDVLFSDEDKIDEAGVRYDPHFKPPWNPDLFLSQNYVSHLGMYRHRLVREVGGFREGYEGSQDYDLALRCIARLDARQVRHVPFVLYSWRSVRGSTARSLGTKSYAEEAAIRAIRDHLRCKGVAADVELSMAPSTYRVRYPLNEPAPSVEVIVPTRDGAAHLQACLEGLTSKTRYPGLRVQVVDNGSKDAATLEVLEAFGRRPDVVVVVDDRPFNFAALNNAAVERTTCPVVCLLNDDIEVVDPDWLIEMVSQVMRPEVGVVGAMLRYPDGAVQHAGVVLGAGGVAAHAHAGHDTPDQGYFSRLATVHEVGAVTGACLVTTRASWDSTGGMDEALAVNFNDVDYCLRVAETGQRVLWTPHAVLVHHESKSRGQVDDESKVEQLRNEAARMVGRWGEALFEDPAYGPNLTFEGAPFGLSDQPRFRAPWWVPAP